MSNSKKTEEAKATTAAVSKTASKAAKTGVKSAAAKTATKKTAASKTEVKTETKPAAAKTATKKAAPAKKTTAKTAAKKTAEKAAPKTAAKKTKAVTIDTICEKLEKKISKTKAAAINKTIAVDIEVYEFEDGSNQKMYVEIKDGKVTVAPYNYDEWSFRVSLSFENAVAFVNGKITLASLLNSEKFYAEGNIADAIKFASIF